MTDIFKVQVPLAGNEPSALVYNRDRSTQLMLPITPALMDFMAGAPKKFVYARIVDENLVIDLEAPWQEW